MSFKRLSVVSSLISMLAIAACGGGESESGPAESTSASAAPPATEAPVTEAPTTTLPPFGTGAIEVGTAADDAAFSYHTLVDGFGGAAGAAAADFNGDGILEILINGFGDIDMKKVTVGTSTLAVLYQTGGPTNFVRDDVVTTDDGYYFFNQPWVGDLDGDGDTDIIGGIGFFVCASIGTIGPCGALVIWENVGIEGGMAKFEATDLVAKGATEFYHRPAVADVDGDGVLDIVAIGETSTDANTVWFRGTANGFDTTAHPVGQGGGSLPVATDVDGDGDIDIVSGQYFLTPESAIWFEQLPAGTDGLPAWQKHVITSSIGKVIQVSLVPDLDGPGTLGWIASNHTNTTRPGQVESGIYRLTPGADPRDEWSVQLLSTGIVSRPSVGTAFQAAPGVFGWGDLDADGDVDLAVSGDGDDRLFILEQTGPSAFGTRVLQTGYAQAGSMMVVDLNNDGRLEILASGFESDQVRLYVS